MINGFEDAQKVGQETLTRALQSFTAFSHGWQALAAETAGFTKQSFEDGAAFLEKLSGVKTFDVAVATQTDYVKSAYEKSVGAATRFSELYLDLAKDVAKPFEPMLQPTK